MVGAMDVNSSHREVNPRLPHFPRKRAINRCRKVRLWGVKGSGEAVQPRLPQIQQLQGQIVSISAIARMLLLPANRLRHFRSGSCQLPIEALPVFGTALCRGARFSSAHRLGMAFRLHRGSVTMGSLTLGRLVLRSVGSSLPASYASTAFAGHDPVVLVLDLGGSVILIGHRMTFVTGDKYWHLLFSFGTVRGERL